MKKRLVAYFSASGVTKKLAQRLAETVNADLFEIQPKTPYTKADLDWMDKESRSSLEMKDKSFRPEIANTIENISSYDIIYLGFPIWWYVAPTIINTFLEQYNFGGKLIIPFATSGTSDMGNTKAEINPSCSGAILRDGKRFDANADKETLKEWADAMEKYNRE